MMRKSAEQRRYGQQLNACDVWCEKVSWNVKRQGIQKVKTPHIFKILFTFLNTGKMNINKIKILYIPLICKIQDITFSPEILKQVKEMQP